VSYSPLSKSKSSPEERELKKKLIELADIEMELADRELELATFQAELHQFEDRYLRIVGWRYAKLDEIRAQIAEAEARLKPDDANAGQEAAQSRKRAEESAREAEALEEVPAKAKFKPSDELKKLYREIARQVHPDLASNDTDRERRNRIMAEVNHAYEKGDIARLEELQQEWKRNPEAVKDEGIGAELVRVIRKIAKVEDRLAAIDEEIEALSESDLQQLRNRVEEADDEGKDLLQEMADDLDREITKAKAEGYEVMRRLVRKLEDDWLFSELDVV